MSYLRFNHVFFGLMALSFLSAFVISPRISDRAGASVSNIFLPVAYPARKLGGWAYGRLARPQVRDDASPNGVRSSDQLIEENKQLHIMVGNLLGQLARLQERESARDVGEVKQFCTPYSVAAADSGNRQSLMLGGSSFDGLRVDMPVLYSGGIAGRISRVGIGEARVRLITDSLSGFEATFARVITGPDGKPQFTRLRPDRPLVVLVKGTGNKTMVTSITRKDCDLVGPQVNDWLVLSDHEWPTALENYPVGFIASIADGKPLFVDITIKPDQDLMALQEVMVMNKEKR